MITITGTSTSKEQAASALSDLKNRGYNIQASIQEKDRNIQEIYIYWDSGLA